MNNELKGIWKMWSWLNLKCYTGIYLEGLSKTMIYLGMSCPEYEARVLRLSRDVQFTEQCKCCV
jgi:hypothetical protein